jgi:predicted AAA+ superfamily ATPase
LEALLYKSNPWWEGEYRFDGIRRDKYLDTLRGWLGNRDIVFLTGLRRVGKTSILKTLIDILIHEEQIDPKHLFYVSLDLYALDEMSIGEIVTAYRKLHKLPSDQKVYLFFDEVTAKPSYRKELKNFYDLENVKIFASSSSALLLKDSRAYLTGRQRMLEVMPLDFDEYLLFRNVQIKQADGHLRSSYFEEYMQDGGMPEYVLTGDVTYLQNLIDNIITKDIIAHHNLRNNHTIKAYFKLLMERSGKQLSFNKIASILEISVDSAKRYFHYFEETYLIYSIEKCGKLNEQIKGARKIYASDVGVRNVITGYRDKGAIYENLVFLKIKDLRPCYLYVDGVEIDFVTENNVLIEAKLNATLNAKQQKLFDAFEAKAKYVANGLAGLMELDAVTGRVD